MRTPTALRAALLLAGFATAGAGVLAQAPTRAFEVASIKLHDPSNPRQMMVADPSGRFTAIGIPLVNVASRAIGTRRENLAMVAQGK